MRFRVSFQFRAGQRLYERTSVAPDYRLPNQIIWYLIARIRIVLR